jgi:hypothetical protein
VPEWLNGTVLKTVERDERSGGSNPPFSSTQKPKIYLRLFCF